MKRGIVQLGAGPVQRGLMERISQTGLVPIVVDRSERPAGLVSTAIHVRAPIDQPDAVLAMLQSELSGLEVGAVLTSTDLGVASVPVVAEGLGLPNATLCSIDAMNDKAVSKEILSRADVRVPKGWLGTSAQEIPRLGGDVEFVVKPVDSSGSRGVSRVCGRAAIRVAVDHALSFSDRFLIEECVEGQHLDVNGFVIDGVFSLVSIGRRYFTEAPACVPLFGGIAAGWDIELASRVSSIMQASVTAFDYRHGPVKSDLIEGTDGLVVLELAARFHGDVFSYHVADAAGLPPAALEWLAQLGLCEAPGPLARHGGWFAVFAEEAGRIKAIEGLEEVRLRAGWRRWIPRLEPGDSVGPPNDNRALVGFGLIGFDESVDLWDEADQRRRAIQVVLE